MISNEDCESADEATDVVYTVSENIKYESRSDADDDCVVVFGSPPQQQSAGQISFPEQSNRQYSFNQITNHSSKRKQSNSSIIKSSNITSKVLMPSAPKSSRLQHFPNLKDGIPASLRHIQGQSTATSTTITKKIQSPSATSRDGQSPVSSSIDVAESTVASNDEDDNIFAKYILSELRQIKDAHVKRVVKHRIQNIIFEAHCSLQN